MSTFELPKAAELPTPSADGVTGAAARLRVKESPVHRTFAAWTLSLISLGIKIGGNVVIIPLALHFLGRQDYGLWIVLQSVGTYLALSDLGIGQTVLNFQNVAYAKGDHQQVNRVLTTVFGLHWIIIGAFWVIAAYIFITQPVEKWFLKDASGSAATLFKGYLALAGTLALLRVPLNVFSATLLGLRELTLRQFFEIAVAISVPLATILTLVTGGKVLVLIWVTNILLIVLPFLPYSMARSRHSYLRLAREFWTPSLVWPLLSNSLFFFLYGLGLLFQRLAGSVLAGKFAGLDSVPAFFVLFTLFRIVGWSLADTISQTMQPYIIMFDVQGRRDRVEFFAQLSTKFTFAAAVIYCLLIWLFADVGLRIWVGPNMFLGYGPLALLGGSFLIDVLFLSTNNCMRGLNRHRALSVVMGIYALLSFVLGIAGARWMPGNPTLGLCWGLFGASVLGQALPLPWIACKWLRIGLRRYLDHFLLRPGLLTACLAMVSAAFILYGSQGFWSRAGFTVIIVLVLPILTWFLVFDDTERHWMHEALLRAGPFGRKNWDVPLLET
jgi:O-antigen/teichoic acid export membrane protein